MFWRRLSSQMSYTLISTSGLALGVAVCLLTFLVIRFESSFDTFHRKKDRTYRIVTTLNSNGSVTRTAGVPLPIARAIRADYPEFEWLAGDKRTALNAPNTVVISEDYAEKYFGNWRNAVGKTLVWENKLLLKVTGILKKLPVNTDLPVHVVISFETVRQTDVVAGWDDYLDYYGKHFCFVVLPKNMPAKQFDTDLGSFVRKYKPTQVGKI